MKNVAIISNSESDRISKLIEFIKDEYNVTTVYGQKNALDLLNSDFDNISVLIIDNPFSLENVSEILSFVKNKLSFYKQYPLAQNRGPGDYRYHSRSCLVIVRLFNKAALLESI